MSGRALRQISAEDHAMRLRTALKSTVFGLLGVSVLASAVYAQEVGGPGKPWRGAGANPCYGADGSANKCVSAPGLQVIRAGQMFDSKTGEMKTHQTIVLDGERIIDVGPESQVKVPPGAQVIDLSQSTVLPGL